MWSNSHLSRAPEYKCPATLDSVHYSISLNIVHLFTGSIDTEIPILSARFIVTTELLKLTIEIKGKDVLNTIAYIPSIRYAIDPTYTSVIWDLDIALCNQVPLYLS